MSPGLTIAKNALSNVVRGGVSGIVAIVLPTFLTRYLSAQQYNAWAIALQLSAYVGYLDLGLQIAVARFVAQATEQNEFERRKVILSSALLLLSLTGGIALIGIALSLKFLPSLNHDLQPGIRNELTASFLLLGCSLSIALPASVLSGALVGVQRNEIPALSVCIARLASALGCIFLVRRTHSITPLAALTAAFTLLSYLPQYLACKRLVSPFKLSFKQVQRQMVGELARYCASLSTWSLGMLLVSGLDLTIVAAVDFKHVGAYSIASTLVLFIAGTTGALFTSFLAPVARMHTREEYRKIGDLVLRCTRAGTFANISLGLPLIFGGLFFLRHWIPLTYAQDAAPLLQVLVIANLIRLVFTPYGVAVQATGQQNRLLAAPLIEGLTNLTASIAAGHYFGAIGVAYGTLVGACVAFVWLIWYHIPRTREINMARGTFLSNGVLRPAGCFLPLVPLIMLPVIGFTASAFLLTCLCAAATGLLSIYWAKIHQPAL